MIQMQSGPGLSIPSLVPCYDEQSCMTNAQTRPLYCSSNPPPTPGYHSGRVLQEMMYQTEMNYPGYIADHRENQPMATTWNAAPWGPRQNVPYLSHPHTDPYQYGYGAELADFQDDASAYAQKRKRSRTAFSADQLKRLEKRFVSNHYIVGEERQKVAKDLELSEAQVKVWFQNRRTKFKRDQELERLGKKKKRKGEHHIRKWQITTKHFSGEPTGLAAFTQDNEDIDLIVSPNKIE